MQSSPEEIKKQIIDTLKVQSTLGKQQVLLWGSGSGPRFVKLKKINRTVENVNSQ